MSKEWDVLVASGNFEHRRSLVRILEGLPLNVISVSTFHQAEEVRRFLHDSSISHKHLACFRDSIFLNTMTGPSPWSR